MTTTKRCPKCGNTHLGLIRTQFLKFCPDCGTCLDPGQRPLLESSRTLEKAHENS